jgi:hypothetical protein
VTLSLIKIPDAKVIILTLSLIKQIPDAKVIINQIFLGWGG